MRRQVLILSLFSLISIVLACFSGLMGGYLSYIFLVKNDITGSINNVTKQDVKVVNEQSAVVDVVSKVSPSVVSIVISKDVPTYENYNYSPFGGNSPFPDDLLMPQRMQTGTQKQEVGAGSGFVISADGMIITNKHVVDDASASYTVIFPDDKKFDAKVLAKDTLLDIAFLKIDATGLTPLSLGSSTDLKVGQSVIAIGNALGRFSNTVSTGIVSGLSRDIIAGGINGSETEALNNVIQTDASINLGNSGGPLLDIDGNVIGVNVAVADAQNIGFAIPIDVVKDLLNRLSKDGKIDRPVLGVRYVLVNDSVKKQYDLSVDYGALVIKGSAKNQPAVVVGSPAEKAGIKENDVILEVDGIKLDSKNPLQSVIQQKHVGDEVTLKVVRDNKEMSIKVKLDKFSE